MYLDLKNVVASPKILDPAGGPVHVDFSASVDTGKGQLTATYTIRSEHPYVFANPPDPQRPRVQQLAAQTVSSVIRRYGRDFRLVRLAGSGSVEFIFVDVLVQLVSGDDAATRTASWTVGGGQALAAALKQQRHATDLSQAVLAAAMGLSRSTVSRAERGLGLSETTVARIAAWSHQVE